MRERRRSALWHIRWDIALWLLCTAMWIAPRGPERGNLIKWLHAWSGHVLATIAANREAE